MKDNNISKNVLILIGSISIVLLIILVVSIILFNKTPEKVINKTLDGGEVVLSYTDEENIFTLTDLVPTSDITGKKFDSVDKYFDFTVSTYLEEADEIEYEIYIKKVNDNSLVKDTDIKFYLEKQKKGTFKSVLVPSIYEGLEKKSKLGTLSDSMILYKEVKTKDSFDNYRLRMWASDTSTIDVNKVKEFSVEVGINAKAK